MNKSLLSIDETGAPGGRATDFLADRTNDRQAGSGEPAWAAVGSMALGVFALVTAEFLPASLLTPIAADFKISEDTAGQTVTATAAFALLSSLLVTAVIRNLDRRIVMLGFTILLLISNLIAAFALNLPMLLIGRVLLGAASANLDHVGSINDAARARGVRAAGLVNHLQRCLGRHHLRCAARDLPRPSFRLARCIYHGGGFVRDHLDRASRDLTPDARRWIGEAWHTCRSPQATGHHRRHDLRHDRFHWALRLLHLSAAVS